MVMSNVTLPKKQREELIKTLQGSFEKNMNRHNCLEWTEVQARLEANAEKPWSLYEMERTGGEPDVVGHDKKTGEYNFMIVPWKALKAVEAFVMTVKRSSQEENTSWKIALLICPLLWALSF
jgi:hypothetical protein